MIMGFLFSIYTFRHTRYMYKRLAACCHLMAAGCVLVVLEVSGNAVSYASLNLPLKHPPGSQWHYGYSYILAWITFSIELLSAIGFAVLFEEEERRTKLLMRNLPLMRNLL
ncbi:hypothetical protein Avbf_13793 [Armadillidium vulgare]|nr:hypothetical protein Avbf_13793 [Armadillidium vulgare]